MPFTTYGISPTRDGVLLGLGATTAIAEDFSGVIRQELPLFIAVIVGLGCLLLLVAFLVLGGMLLWVALGPGAAPMRR